MHAPPNSDHPFHQYLRKITAQNQLRPLTAPTNEASTPNQLPPRYTPAVVSHDFEDDYDDEYEDFDEYDESYDFDNVPNYYPSQTPLAIPGGTSANSNDTKLKTLTINLDSSITITSDENTVAIASGQAQTKPQPNTSAPKSKLANTAAAIITALQQSGVSSSASVEINIDAGVRVEGSRNVVCFGGVIVPNLARTGAANVGAGAGVRKMNMQPNASANSYNARKRRAQSEPAAISMENKKPKN
ncbi:hypothetical protein BDV06DRAFT_224716 [Aspergillus oleicola]